ncbi:hypothetical protein XENTR_v10005982 [Xenopus tropicalis]|uniref:Glutathione S-transferase 3, mitochondrial n=1 Tax=Xenopus tropicalis TaxID=8364 RepID=Q28C18_XENTR|nr:provisional ortholog of microsomal glutathione S-transferase 3 [Xenopus tropicalis]XP_031751943.1 microsomal glutathione S-transferase 3-like isoform X1 [Xenopus tropicalis]AAI67568.1 LOC734071 protein [Xenopus tropicalis]KAE8624546.1 hypothetical protein XENTR_v10005982 [Xenopus tropicalis]CAJ82262.1 microsomal glutathione S-transferase 3-like [Xenopus tropicalis]|eukprot:NP_001039212.1 microsomal glutathione S-transferase 3-like [Xenopus tropicalis]
MATTVHDVLPSNFAYVIFTYIYSVFMIMYLSMKVMGARKKYGVKYPEMYSKDQMFNCVQRAHQNTMEVYPVWVIFQLIAGLAFPLAAAVLGAIWVTSRFSYAWGYYTGDPQKRMKAAYGYIGYFGLMLLSIAAALQLLQII